MKLLEQNFNDMRNLAEYLVSNLFVNNKSVSAFTVIAAMEEAGAQKGVQSVYTGSKRCVVNLHRLKKVFSQFLHRHIRVCNQVTQTQKGVQSIYTDTERCVVKSHRLERCVVNFTQTEKGVQSSHTDSEKCALKPHRHQWCEDKSVRIEQGLEKCVDKMYLDEEGFKKAK